jgi:hypothetical protein
MRAQLGAGLTLDLEGFKERLELFGLAWERTRPLFRRHLAVAESLMRR